MLTFFCIFFLPSFDQMGPLKTNSGGLLDPGPLKSNTCYNANMILDNKNVTNHAHNFFCIFFLSLFEIWILSGGLLDPGPSGL